MTETISASMLTQVEAIIPTANKEKGEWKLLINKKKYQPCITWLNESWEDIIKTIPCDMKDASPFDRPKISSRTSATTEAKKKTEVYFIRQEVELPTRPGLPHESAEYIIYPAGKPADRLACWLVR